MTDLPCDNYIVCTQCGHCLPCPAKIKIPELMEVVHLHRHTEYQEQAFELYKKRIDPEGEAKSSLPIACYQCGRCELKCPERIKVIAELKYLVEVFPEFQDKEKGQQ